MWKLQIVFNFIFYVICIVVIICNVSFAIANSNVHQRNANNRLNQNSFRHSRFKDNTHALNPCNHNENDASVSSNCDTSLDNNGPAIGNNIASNPELFPSNDHRIKPLFNSKTSVESKLRFERPPDKDTAEEVIKATEKDMLRLRHTREQIKKTEQEQKHKREQEQKKKKEEEQKRKAEQVKKEALRKREQAMKRPRPKPKPTPRRRYRGEEEFKRLEETVKQRKRPVVKRPKNHTVHWTNPPQSWTAGIPLCGYVSVVKDSVIVRSTCDLRSEISIGEGIRIGTHETTVVNPRDGNTLTLSDPYPNVTNPKTKAYKIDYKPHTALGCKALPGKVDVTYNNTLVRTTMDLRTAIGTGETIRIHNEEFTVTLPRDEITLTLSNPYPFKSNGLEDACKKVRPWDGGVSPIGCCVATTEYSNIVRTTRDFRNDLKLGDMIRIRTETFKIEAPFTGTSFIVSPESRLVSGSGLWAYKVSDCSELPGTVSVAKGQSVVTTEKDLRSILTMGDTVEIGSEEYEVTASVDPSEFYINRAWEYAPMTGIKIQRCVAPKSTSSATRLPCSVELQRNSMTAKTTCDLTNDISIGETVKLCGETFLLIPPQDAGTMTLARPWKQPDARCVAWREGESDKERVLDELQIKRMKCQSLYCLAKIEEEERAIAMTLDRSMYILTHPQHASALREDDLHEDGVIKDENKSASGAAGNATSPTGNRTNIGPDGKKLESSEALYENARELTRRADITKTSEDIATAEKAMEIAQSREYEEKFENSTEKLSKVEILRKKLHNGELRSGELHSGEAINPSESPVIPQRIEAEKSSIPEVAARSIKSVKEDIKILQGKINKGSNDAIIEDGNGDVTGTGKKDNEPEPDKNQKDGGLMGGSLAMPNAPAVSSTFKWWLENGIDHKYNQEMQSRLNLRPSGKDTHGGELKDNEDGLKKIKEQGKETNGSEEAQGQQQPAPKKKGGSASEIAKKLSDEVKKQGPFE
eukprot:g3017.t1